jgi:hypothetical protein
MRLEQRTLPSVPPLQTRLAMGARAMSYVSFNLFTVLGFSLLGILPALLPTPYALQWIETIWGTFHPAVGVKPTRIGMRQLIYSTLFTILFILTWEFSP